MKRFITILLLAPALFAATLLNQNIYERDSRIDLMLSFDTPFKGTIRKSTQSDGSLDIKLSGVRILKPFRKELHNALVEAIAVTGTGETTALIKITPADKPLRVDASKTIDGFGLRLRILPAAAERGRSEAAPLPAVNESAPPPLNTLKASDTLPGWRYWSVLAIMLLLLLALWIVRRKKFAASGGGGWLMPKVPGNKQIPEGAVIRYQKPLDPQNRLLLLEFNGRQYLMVVGSSNLLLDTFSQERIEDPESFTSLFEANKKQLDRFLKENHPDAYETFKANASKDDPL
ncbi:hypothetical protein [Hydrogenimonas sp.]